MQYKTPLVNEIKETMLCPFTPQMQVTSTWKYSKDLRKSCVVHIQLKEVKKKKNLKLELLMQKSTTHHSSLSPNK